MPYSAGGEHCLGNALLFRSDFHTLFDRGYVTITPDYKFEVSGSIREHFNNGVRYEDRRGRKNTFSACKSGLNAEFFANKTCKSLGFKVKCSHGTKTKTRKACRHNKYLEKLVESGEY